MTKVLLIIATVFMGLFFYFYFGNLHQAKSYCDQNEWHDVPPGTCRSNCTKDQYNDCDATNIRTISCTGGSCTAPTATPGGNPNVQCGTCSCPGGGTVAKWCTPNCSATNACWCDPCGGGGGGGSGCCSLDSQCTANYSCYNCSPGNCAGSCDSNDQCSAAGYGGACTYRCVADPTSPPNSTPTPTFPPLCGNLSVDPGEACDNYIYNSNTVPNACRLNCQWPICGDYVVDNTNAAHGGVNEECDAGSDNNVNGFCSNGCLQLPEYSNSCNLLAVGPYAYDGVDFTYSYRAQSNANTPGSYAPLLQMTHLRNKFGIDLSAPNIMYNEIIPSCSSYNCTSNQTVTIDGDYLVVSGIDHSLTVGLNIWSTISGEAHQCESNWYSSTPPSWPNENSLNGCDNNCRTTIPIIKKVEVSCNNFTVNAGTVNASSNLTITGKTTSNFAVDEVILQYQILKADNTTTNWTAVPGATCTKNSSSIWTCVDVIVPELLPTDQEVRFELIPNVTLDCRVVTNRSTGECITPTPTPSTTRRCRSTGWTIGYAPNNHPNTYCNSNCYAEIPVGDVPYTPTPTPTVTLTPIPTNTPTPTPIGAPTATPTHTPSPTPTPTSSVPTATPTNTPAVAPAFWGELFYDFNQNGVYETQCDVGHIAEKIDYATFGCTGAGCTDCSPKAALAALIGPLNRSLEGFELLVQGSGQIWGTNPKIRLAAYSSNPFYSWNVAQNNSYTLTLTDPRSTVRNCSVTTGNPRNISVGISTVGNINTGIFCSAPANTPTPTPTAPIPTSTATSTPTPTSPSCPQCPVTSYSISNNADGTYNVNVTWNLVPNVDSYQVWGCVGSGCSLINLYTATAGTNSITFTNFNPCTYIYFSIRPYNASCTTPNCSTTMVTLDCPTPPTSLSCDECDINDNGVVQHTIDMNVITSCFMQPIANACAKADLNNDLIIDISDNGLFASNCMVNYTDGQSCGVSNVACGVSNVCTVDSDCMSGLVCRRNQWNELMCMLPDNIGICSFQTNWQNCCVAIPPTPTASITPTITPTTIPGPTATPLPILPPVTCSECDLDGDGTYEYSTQLIPFVPGDDYTFMDNCIGQSASGPCTPANLFPGGLVIDFYDSNRFFTYGDGCMQTFGTTQLSCSNTPTPTPTLTPTPTPGPYWQIQGGNLFSNGDTTVLLPDLFPLGTSIHLADKDPNYASNTTAGAAISNGLLSIGSGLLNDFSANFSGEKVEETSSSICSDYTFASFADSLDLAHLTSQGPSGTMIVQDFDYIYGLAVDRGDYKLFYREDNLRLNIGVLWTINADPPNNNKPTIVVVDGNLEVASISLEQLIDLNSNTFLGFIVSGDIIFESSVGNVVSILNPDNEASNVEGLFFTTDGQIIVQSATLPAEDKRFVGEGTFIGCGGVELQRALQISNNKTEIFRFNPDLLLNVPSDLREAHISWQEIN